MGAREQISLCDHNVWLALVLPAHNHHDAARAWWGRLEAERAVFCRSTQQGFLRLLTTEAVLVPYGLPARTQAQAWAIYHRISSDPCVGFLTEPAGLGELWEQLSSRESASPQLWMDAYLAAFAIKSGCELVTFDQGFRQFEPHHLRLKWLGSL
jgi:toxin-antitoxin system PIN domain toxin